MVSPVVRWFTVCWFTNPLASYSATLYAGFHKWWYPQMDGLQTYEN